METIDNLAVAQKSAHLSDFDRRWAQGITSEEFLCRMYKFIDSLPWEERSSTQTK
ncbi:hypothetical protein FACS189456_2460 [Bacteroidia bacterium]|nr:hypothetical protein FACS189456_2460 [Bacteroidia bacterium]